MTTLVKWPFSRTTWVSWFKGSYANTIKHLLTGTSWELEHIWPDALTDAINE